MEPRLRGPERDPETGRRFGERHAQVVVPNDQRSMIGREFGERTVERIPIGQQREGVMWRRVVDRCRRDLMTRRFRRRASSIAALTISRWSQASNPAGISQSRQVAPGPDECLLDRVAGDIAITGDEAGGRVQSRGGCSCKHGKGVAIASLCLFHERPLVHGRSLVRRDSRGRARMVWRRLRPIRFADLEPHA